MLRYDDMLEASLLLMGMAAGLTLGAVVLMTLGRRAWRSAGVRGHGSGVNRTAVSALCLLTPVSCLLLSSGCSDRTKPDEVWLSTGTGKGQVVYPRAIAYSATDDTFFVIDRLARVQHLDRDGQYLNEWRMPDYMTGKPVGVSVGPDGNVYVPDTHYQRVMVYSPKGEVVRTWGSAGKEPGQFIYPTDIAFDSKGNVFVTEYGDNDRVQVFDAEGKFLYQFASFGGGDGQIARPQSILIDQTDTVYITDACNHRIAVFKTDGTFLRSMGGPGSDPGQFRYPYGLAESSDGKSLVVCEFGNNRVQKIDKATGKGLVTWGVAGHALGELAYPWGVAVDRKGRVVTVDSGNNRLQLFTF
jgi:DNA-binding beta-propeller fold protein YncE